tara:strand:+ start:524 stop:883 length:360 start_codon:yes stop_codon:yes gene_type:complete
MKITKIQLHKLVSETLREVRGSKKVITTEATELADVERLKKVLGRVGQFEALLQTINTKPEFLEFIKWIIDQADNDLPTENDAVMAVKQTLVNMVKAQTRQGSDGEEGNSISPEVTSGF